MSSEPKGNPLHAVDSADIYKEALGRVLAELEELKLRKTEMAARELQLHQSIKALMPLVGSTIPDVQNMSLSNAVRTIFRGLAPDRYLTAIDVRTKLEELGFDLSGYENPLASIHTCLRRMLESDEISEIKSEDDNKKKKFEAGPELRPVPELQELRLEE